MTLPVPSLLLNTGNKFTNWYPGQEEAVSSIMDWVGKPVPPDSNRFMCLSCPTGSGKSLCSILAAKLSGSRTVILTATKGLQAQIVKDFGNMVTDIRGQNSYQCIASETGDTCDSGPCHLGYNCPYKDNGCIYYDKVKEAKYADIVVTNYAYWLNQNYYSSGLGVRDMLICDEAHLAFGALESFLTNTIDIADAEFIGSPMPDNPNEWNDWQRWAAISRLKAAKIASETKDEMQKLRDNKKKVPGALSSRYLKVVAMDRKLSIIESSVGKWIAEKSANGWTFPPVWIGDYSKLIYNDIPKVMLMSAILTPESADHLAVPKDRTFLSMPSLFPSQNTPVTHIKTVRMNHKSSNEDLKQMVYRIDQIIEQRKDRKGIIFTVSYKRRNMIISNSIHQDIMMSHDQRNVVDVVNRFKNSQPPVILVSPSVTTGWDFKYDECRYIIICKLPYPDTSSELVKARLKDDPDWTSFMAMQTLIQEAGRATRAADDFAEVLIIDDSWKWFWPRYKKYAPLWFHQRVRRSTDIIPSPLIPSFHQPVSII